MADGLFSVSAAHSEPSGVDMVSIQIKGLANVGIGVILHEMVHKGLE